MSERTKLISTPSTKTAGKGRAPLFSPSTPSTISIDESLTNVASAPVSDEDDVEGGGEFSLRRSSATVDEVLVVLQQRVAKKTHFKSFYKILLLIAVFYFVPAIQFVAAKFNEYKETPQSDPCYFNFKCAWHVLGFGAFNNVLSNIGYLVIGSSLTVYFLYVQRRDLDSERGLSHDQSLFIALALSEVIEAFFSAMYHTCPSRIDFQFDSTFLTIGSALLFTALFARRHPASLVGAVKFYAWLGIACALIGFSVTLPQHPIVFWFIILLLLVYLHLMGAYALYHRRKLRLLSIEDASAIVSSFRALPTYKWRAGFILLGVVCNITIVVVAAFVGVSKSSNLQFPSILLGVLMLDFLIYLIYYIIQKYRHGERLLWYAWIVLVLAFVVDGLSLYFFSHSPTNKFLTPAESRKLNQPCILFGKFDSHDVWHFLSAIGTGLLILGVYLIDEDVADTDRKDIHVF